MMGSLQERMCESDREYYRISSITVTPANDASSSTVMTTRLGAVPLRPTGRKAMSSVPVSTDVNVIRVELAVLVAWAYGERSEP